LHQPATWFELGAFFSMGAIVYLLALFTLGLNKSEREDLNRAFGKIVGIFQ
jgi:hypothetical protein